MFHQLSKGKFLGFCVFRGNHWSPDGASSNQGDIPESGRYIIIDEWLPTGTRFEEAVPHVEEYHCTDEKNPSEALFGIEATLDYLELEAFDIAPDSPERRSRQKGQGSSASPGRGHGGGSSVSPRRGRGRGVHTGESRKDNVPGSHSSTPPR